MKRADLETLINEKTGSAFHILAKNAKYVCAFRLFLGSNEFHLPTLYFRLRMEKAPTFVSQFPTLKLDLAQEFPSAVWSKISSNYASMVGEVVFSCAPTDQVGMLELYQSNKVAAHIHQFIVSSVGEMQFFFNEAGFTELCDDYLGFLLDDLKSKMPSIAPGQVVLALPTGTHLLHKGFEVTQVELDDVVSFTEGTVVVPKNVPKDAGLTGDAEVPAL